MSYTIRMKKNLNTRQNSFVKHIASGRNATQSAILAGYSKRSARFTASKLLTNANVLQQLEVIFDKAGLSDEALVDKLKTAIDAGIGQKATNGDALKGLRMIFELKNKFPSPQLKAEVTQEDEIHMKLEQMSRDELAVYLEETTAKTLELVERLKQRRLKRKNEDDNKQSVIPLVKLNPVEPISSQVASSTSIPEDIGIRRAVGILQVAKPIKQPTYKSNAEAELSEDEHYHPKISYPA